MESERYRKYLRRIGIDHIEPPTYEFLATILKRHIYTVPFENLDCYFKVPVLLDLDYAYHEIVELRSGGWCVEQNYLLHHLLEWLGFRVQMVGGAVYESDGSLCYPCSHLLIVVFLDKPYLIDVGYGDCFRVPMPIDDGDCFDTLTLYRLDFDSVKGDYTLLRKGYDGLDRWVALYRFTLQERAPSEFIPGFHYLLNKAEHFFNTSFVCTISRDYGRLTLIDNQLTTTVNHKKHERALERQEQVFDFLRNEIGISEEKLAHIPLNPRFLGRLSRDLSPYAPAPGPEANRL